MRQRPSSNNNTDNRPQLIQSLIDAIRDCIS